MLKLICPLAFIFTGTPATSCNNNIDTTALQKDVLVLTNKIDLPGVSGRIDHIAYDTAHHLAFIAALGNNTIEVVNTLTGAHVHTISDLHEPQGVCYLPAVNRLVVANGGNGDCIFFDCNTFKPIKHIPLNDDADNLRYDASAGKVYAGYGDGGIAVIDAASMQQTVSIPVNGHPESFQLDSSGKKLYINVPDAHEIAIANIETASVTATWKNSGASGNFPMAADSKLNRLFVVYRHPAQLKVFDLSNGKLIVTTGCSGDADDIFMTRKKGLFSYHAGRDTLI
ncbi:MAG TPA: YncE family protein [Chitinophagaceae bacterium]|nr:YncE family protein [Chitinophagaceae bacterium]